MEHGLGLTAETRLLAVVTPLACAHKSDLQFLVFNRLNSRRSSAVYYGRTGRGAKIAEPWTLLGLRPHSTGGPASGWLGLLGFSPSCTLRVKAGLASLVLGHLVHGMLLALLAEALLRLRNVHLRFALFAT